MRSTPGTILLRYCGTVICTTQAVWLRRLLDLRPGDRIPFLTRFAGLVFTARQGGGEPLYGRRK